jgi:hypothetical protein
MMILVREVTTWEALQPQLVYREENNIYPTEQTVEENSSHYDYKFYESKYTYPM